MIIISLLLQLLIPERIGINKKRIIEIILIISIILNINILEIENINKGIGIYNGLYIEDSIGKLIEIIIYVISILIIKYMKNILVITIIIIGMISILYSNDLLGIILGIELETLGIYIIIGRESKRKNSIGIKYFILGAISSSFIYLGISIIYGEIGIISIEEIKIIKEIDNSINIPINILIFGLIFKLGGVPLHNYLSDIIEGININISIWILGLSKITIIIIINKLNIYKNISEILLITIQLSLIVGAIVGTIQKRIKRLITYSSINNIGNILLSVLININIIKIGLILYILHYILTTINIILIIYLLGIPSGDIIELKKIRNNSIRLCILIAILSLIGIPPLLGFYSKLYILIPIIDIGMKNIIVIIVIGNIISSYYYIKLIKIIYNFNNTSIEPKKGFGNSSGGFAKGEIGIISILLILLPTKEIINILNILI